MTKPFSSIVDKRSKCRSENLGIANSGGEGGTKMGQFLVPRPSPAWLAQSSEHEDLARLESRSAGVTAGSRYFPGGESCGAGVSFWLALLRGRQWA